MTPADDRVLQLLQKWQKSLNLHARYADLPATVRGLHEALTDVDDPDAAPVADGEVEE